jgi:hypothetical protein
VTLTINRGYEPVELYLYSNDTPSRRGMGELYLHHILEQKTFDVGGEIPFKNELHAVTPRQQQH